LPRLQRSITSFRKGRGGVKWPLWAGSGRVIWRYKRISVSLWRLGAPLAQGRSVDYRLRREGPSRNEMLKRGVFPRSKNDRLKLSGRLSLAPRSVIDGLFREDLLTGTTSRVAALLERPCPQMVTPMSLGFPTARGCSSLPATTHVCRQVSMRTVWEVRVPY